MMRLPLFEFRSPRTIAEAARILDGEGSERHGARRRHRLAAENEAAATGTAHADESSERGRTARDSVRRFWLPGWARA